MEVPATVKLQVLDATGKSVRTLQQPVAQQAGVYSLVWNGRNDSGGALPDGRYTVRVAATVGGSPVTDTAAVSLNTSLGRLAISPTQYAPAGGALTARYALAAPARVSAAVVQGNRTVRTLKPATSQASGNYSLSWDGRDSTGALATEGGYSVVVVADGSAGRSVMRRDLHLDPRAPLVTNVRVSSPRFYVNGATSQGWSYYLGEPATVELRVTRAGQTVVTLRSGQNAGGRGLTWNGYQGGALAPAGTYGYSITATDAAGNRSALTSGSFAVVR